MFLIIDNKSRFLKELEQEFDKQQIPYLVCGHSEQLSLSSLQRVVKGIILSGGSGTPFGPLNLSANYVALMNFTVPVLGVCLGMEIIAAAFGAQIKKLAKPQNKMERIVIDANSDPLFKDVPAEIMLRKSHRYFVASLPNTLLRLGHSATCENEIIRHKERPVYGFQSHPEVSGDAGMLIIKNFLALCG